MFFGYTAMIAVADGAIAEWFATLAAAESHTQCHYWQALLAPA
jgi:hypothetical protein